MFTGGFSWPWHAFLVPVLAVVAVNRFLGFHYICSLKKCEVDPVGVLAIILIQWDPDYLSVIKQNQRDRNSGVATL